MAKGPEAKKTLEWESLTLSEYLLCFVAKPPTIDRRSRMSGWWAFMKISYRWNTSQVNLTLAKFLAERQTKCGLIPRRYRSKEEHPHQALRITLWIRSPAAEKFVRFAQVTDLAFCTCAENLISVVPLGMWCIFLPSAWLIFLLWLVLIQLTTYRYHLHSRDCVLSSYAVMSTKRKHRSS